MEAFADGVFAIAFTLPVVEIVLPPPQNDGAALAAQLQELWPHYFGYILASFVIGLYWVHHHFSGAIYRTTGHWFLIATAVFLAMIGFIAFPARVFAEHISDPAAREAASRYWVLCLTLLSWSWLLKWTVGMRRGQVDARLEPAYIKRLNHRYWRYSLLITVSAGLVLVHWPTGLAVSTLLLLWLLRPPETPRYVRSAPIIEGETD